MNTAPGVKVEADLGQGWLQCRDAQGPFYFNQVTSQSSDTLPPGIGMAPAKGQTQVVASAMPAATQGAILTKTIADWEIWKDGQGEFYKHAKTGQQYDTAPEELATLLTALNSAMGTGSLVTLDPAWDQATSYSTEPVVLEQYRGSGVPTGQTYTPGQAATSYASTPAATSYASPPPATSYASPAPAATSYSSPQAATSYMSPQAKSFASPQAVTSYGTSGFSGGMYSQAPASTMQMPQMGMQPLAAQPIPLSYSGSSSAQPSPFMRSIV